MDYFHATIAPELLNSWLVVDVLVMDASIPQHVILVAVSPDVWRVLRDLFKALPPTMGDSNEGHLLQGTGYLFSLLLGDVAILDPHVGTALGCLLHSRDCVEAARLVLRFINWGRRVELRCGDGFLSLRQLLWLVPLSDVLGPKRRQGRKLLEAFGSLLIQHRIA